ncbi:SIMPL domain-containing protein [Amaricoccus solimangrovi]|uniref:DUF541 domain-containing protein n=1 Tax=Amaricoccus solimangrovi TaxID=2589815 RepID=A0A501WG94_9RHOB|nr:SIMPL domain-containing protein [Amaricoccus solimangrovi]TPE47360.1 DUF541 domain-containing protein [Amaricoccus solimangrovi]
MRPVLLAALLAAPLLPPLAAAPAVAENAPPARIVTVTGSGRVSAAPDIATISGGVETQAPTAAGALSANSEAMGHVLAALEGLGVAKADIQTTRLSLDPVWDQPENGRAPGRITGYEAGNMVTITLRDTARLGAAIDAMSAGGANRIYGISFDIADPREQLDKARETAVKDARAKAETLARSAGVGLGEVLTIDESVRGGGPAPMRAQMEAAPPVSAGSVELGTDVTITYALR